jgi:pyruvate formate lyase activating enzyme
MIANYHSIETFSSVDGPGIRYVLFLQGCNLLCPYCHNPDATLKKNSLTISTDEVVNDYHKYASFYAHGGLTVSGGEPLLQPDFLIDLFMKLKQNDVHTCIETQGTLFCEDAKFEQLISLTDLFIVNLKATGNAEAQNLFGCSLDRTLAFLDYLNVHGRKFQITYVLIPSVNDSVETLRSLGRLISGYDPKLMSFQMLPFHQLGKDKWKQSGLKYTFEDIREATSDDVRRAMGIITSEMKEKSKEAI